MRLLFTLIFIIVATTGAFAKGCAGKYYFKGTAYISNDSILRNVELVVKIGSVTKKVRTDQDGQYEIDVPLGKCLPFIKNCWSKEKRQ